MGETFRSICKPKFKLTDDEINAVRDGNFSDNRALKCYTNCVMEMMKSIKRGKFQYDTAISQIDTLLPDDFIEPYKRATEICKNSGEFY